jgi:tyrosine-protein kinase STYK1
VAARNILIQSDLTPKLCHLGLAYEVHAHGAISSARSSTIPLKWLAPERLLLRPASIRGDMYVISALLLPLFVTWAFPLNMNRLVINYLQLSLERKT